MLRIFKKIKIGIARKTFLITGAPGTGKEGIANAIHRLSKQKSELISINAAASSSTLEDELFGHKKGAFTDAIEDRTGGIELANNGTLFLDEIGDVSQQIQKSVLRVLETNKVKKIGEEIEKSVKFKLVTATNRDLSQRVATGEMRDDFYSRINGMKIHLPPLSERKGDIPLLSNHFFHKQFVEYQENDDHLKHSFKITSGDFKPLENRDWVLGNIRDLKNHIEDLAATYFGWLREDYEIDRNLFHKLVEDPEFDIEESESISAIINDQEKECLGSMIKNDFKIVAVAENMSLGRDKVQSVINNALLKFGSKVEYSVESMVQLIVDKLQLEDPEQRFKLLNEIDLRFTKILSHNQVSPKIYSKELIDLVLELENIRKI